MSTKTREFEIQALVTEQIRTKTSSPTCIFYGSLNLIGKLNMMSSTRFWSIKIGLTKMIVMIKAIDHGPI